MSDSLFTDLLVDRAPWHKRLSAAMKEEMIPPWLMGLWLGMILLGTALIVWGGEAGRAAGAIPLSVGFTFMAVFGAFFLWSRLRMRPTYDNDSELDRWSLKRKLKGSQVVAAERVGRFELAALLGSKNYQALAIDRDRKRLYSFVLNPFYGPQHALRVTGETLEAKAVQYDRIRQEEEAKEQLAQRLTEKILADV